MRFKQPILHSIVFVMCKNNSFVVMFKFILQFFVLKIKISHFKTQKLLFFEKKHYLKRFFCIFLY